MTTTTTGDLLTKVSKMSNQEINQEINKLIDEIRFNNTDSLTLIHMKMRAVMLANTVLRRSKKV